MSGLQKESRTDPVAGSSSMIEPSMMVQSEGYFNTVQPTAAWTGTSACSQLCRMCATENEYLIPIFEGEGVEHQLGMKIEKHLPIRVHVGDTLPLHVCYQCASTLIAWHDLVVGCIEAEKKLLQIQAHGRAESQVEEVDVKSADSALFFPEQMDTDGGAEPSTSGATNVPTRGSPKKTVPKANPKLKMVIVKTPTAPAAASSRVVAPKTEAIPDTAERSPPPPPPSTASSVTFEAFQPPPPSRRRRPRAAFTCDECGDSFARKPNLDKHLEEHAAASTATSESREPPRKRSTATSESREPPRKRSTAVTYVCEECGRKFALKDSYSRHLRIHSGERPFTCHVCGKQFRDSGGLARHLKDVHVGVKAFACELCGRAFASKATRDDHRRTHTGERPYVCARCGKAFKSKASLYTHAKTHTDVFPHACTHCDKRFRRRQEMLAHASTHTGDKPHVCDVCAKSFRVRGELLRHKLVHSDLKPFVCEVCSLGFRQKRYLRNHQKSRHSGVDTAPPEPEPGYELVIGL